MSTKNDHKEREQIRDYEPACLNSNSSNLEDGFYCMFCGMPFYDCFCCHD